MFALVLIPLTVSAQPRDAAQLIPATFATLVEAVRPAIVTIDIATVRGAPNAGLRSEATAHDFEEELFEDFSDDQRFQRRIATGVIVSSSGRALTSARAAGIARRLGVTMFDGARVEAEVIGVDWTTDVAVLKLPADRAPFPSLPLGDSTKVAAGEWVIAVGSPYGLETTVTAGVIIAGPRPTSTPGSVDVLQTDAALGTGSAGGPLINMRGEVIGINTNPRGHIRIGLAISSNDVKAIYTELLERGRVVRPWLGVFAQPLTPGLARALGATGDRGVLIADVMPGGPAARARIRPGDILLEFGGKPLRDPGELHRALARARVLQVVRVRLLRGARSVTLDVKLGGDPDEREALIAEEDAMTRLGFVVRPVPSGVGVLVVAIDPDGAAAQADLRRGDVVREINRGRVQDLEEFTRRTKNIAAGEPLLILFQRGTEARYVLVNDPT